jgi:hypothetical protein
MDMRIFQGIALRPISDIVSGLRQRVLRSYEHNYKIQNGELKGSVIAEQLEFKRDPNMSSILIRMQGGGGKSTGKIIDNNFRPRIEVVANANVGSTQPYDKALSLKQNEENNALVLCAMSDIKGKIDDSIIRLPIDVSLFTLSQFTTLLNGTFVNPVTGMHEQWSRQFAMYLAGSKARINAIMKVIDKHTIKFDYSHCRPSIRSIHDRETNEVRKASKTGSTNYA